MSLIQALKEDEYKWGNLQSIPYSPQNPAFKEDFLHDLYFQFRGSRFHKTRPGNNILEVLFCGMQDVSYNAITSYLAKTPLCIMGIWQDDGTFRTAGIHFTPVKTGGMDGEAMCISGYGFLKEFWGSEEMETLTVLGIAQIFGELNVKQIHGIRYTTNEFTARYMARFGFHDLCTIPNWMMRNGKLVDGVLSTLSRNEYESNLLQRVLSK
jgi:RimJ/RimL family protein N-acetyltransferase